MPDTNIKVSAMRTAWSFVLIVIASLICFSPASNNGLLQWDDDFKQAGML